MQIAVRKNREFIKVQKYSLTAESTKKMQNIKRSTWKLLFKKLTIYKDEKA